MRGVAKPFKSSIEFAIEIEMLLNSFSMEIRDRNGGMHQYGADSSCTKRHHPVLTNHMLANIERAWGDDDNIAC